MSAADYDYVIVGGGIAGLAIAEIFARSGRSVVLIERNAQLCQETSATQHGWFHFGSLYSIFPQNQFLRTMVGGVEDLLEYYSGFPGMNIQVSKEGRLAFPQYEGAWLRDEAIEYIVCARNDPDFDMSSFEGMRQYAKKVFFLLTWEMAIKQFVSRHQRFHKHNWAGATPASQWIPRAGFADYSRGVITKPNHPGVSLDIDTHFRIVGYDRPMRATAIITDLVRSLVASGGSIRTLTEIERIDRTASVSRLHVKGGESITARTVILSAGKWVGRFLPRSEDVKVVASPLLVTFPAVADTNFVRMTPFVEKSLNHLHHEVDGLRYSLIGGGYFADPKDPSAIARAKERLVTMARGVFPKLQEAQVLETYLGYKTEIVAKSGERNYQYFIREVNDNLYAAMPGKFSLAFSLAVNLYRRLTGEAPRQLATPLGGVELAQLYVGLTRHASLVRGGISAGTSKCQVTPA
jgi:glycine/D-amino acid oxidase-like deaminating enzyme